jgi:hypothetical protein
MDKYYEAFKNIRGNRDIVFETVLDYFDNKPLSILEIGCARNLDLGSRQSDGWSTCFWADYISKNTGWVDIYDISEESINNCRKLVKYWTHAKSEFDHSITFCFHNEECDDFRDYDLIFLDGGDDPNQTLSQFKQTGSAVVLIDDFHTKGRLIQDKPDTLWHFENGHELVCFGGPKLGRVELKLL